MKWLLTVICFLPALSDIRFRKIPNRWLEIWFFTGFLLAGLFPGVSPGALPWKLSGLTEILAADGRQMMAAGSRYLLRAAGVTAVLYPWWRLRIFGAGDVKLCGVLAGWAGITGFLVSFAAALAAGGILSAFRMIRYRSLWKRLSYFRSWMIQCKDRKKWLPYDLRRGYRRMDTIPFAAVLFLGSMVWAVSRTV